MLILFQFDKLSLPDGYILLSYLIGVSTWVIKRAEDQGNWEDNIKLYL